MRLSLVYVVGDALSKGIAFLLIPIYTRNMTPAEYGIWAICLTVVAFLTPLVSLGLTGAVTRYYVDFDNEQERKKFIGTVFLFLVVIGGTVMVILDRTGDVLFAAIFRDVPFHPYLRLTLWTSYFTLLGTIPIAVLRIQEKAVTYSFLMYGTSILKVVLAVYLVVVAQRGLLGAVEGMFWATAIFLPIYIGVVLRNATVGWKSAWMLQALAFSLPLVPHTLAHWALRLSDRIILERFANLGELGIYSLGYQIIGIVSIVLTGMNNAWVPFLLKNYTRPDAKAFIGRLSTYFVLVTVIITIGALLFGRYLVYIFADPEYYSAVTVMFPVALGHLFLGLYFVPVNYLFIAKRTRGIALATGTGAVVNVLANLWLVPRYGMVAAAWNTALAYLIMFAAVTMMARPLRVATIERQRVVLVLLIAAGMMVVDALLSSEPLWLPFILRAVLFVSLPLLLYVVGFYNLEEQSTLRKWMGRIS
ncbi:MAG: oligosaccharide flippase family protein [Fidelibacterota bacterium]|nr:MAG: oligosaccharide flippase family protein [Candidatus Neomarinimicrobiota bacterium]